MSMRDEDLLREAIREVLAELLPGLLEDALAAPTVAGNGHRPQAAAAGEAEALVPMVPAPPIARVHRPSGWRAPDTAPAGSPAQAAAPTIRVETGAVTERTVKEAARTGARLVLSSRAVLTPLARDSARSLGVEIEKESRC